jgi:GNAT superfamily N-acetyltransferase
VLELREIPTDRRTAREATAVERLAARRVATRFMTQDEARAEAEKIFARVADSSAWVDVVAGEETIGWAWLGAEGEELVVYELDLDPTSRADDLLVALLERARAQGARMIGIGVGEGDAARLALATLPGFTVRATNMALRLDGEIADPRPLSLAPMTAAEFDVWMDGEVEAYAVELAATGMSSERALERSREQMAELIPAGVESPGMEFFWARVGNDVVGDLWLDTAQTMAFVYNIEVGEEHRRRGYGAAIMNAAALHCREGGHPYLGLNVFGHNPNARALYDKLGYHVTLDYRALDIVDGD